MIAEAVLKSVQEANAMRLRKIANARRAYAGDYDRPLLKSKSDPDARDNTMLNLGAVVVNKGVSFLMGNDVQWEVGDGASEIEKRAKCDLDAIWKQNKRMLFMNNIAQNGGITGDMFIKIMPPREHLGETLPRLINLDPATVEPILGMDDCDTAEGYVIQWNAMDNGTPVVRRQIISPVGDNTWEILDQISRGNQSNWVLLSRDVWPYPWPPIFHGNNLPESNVYFGISDLEAHVISVNNAVNMVISNINRILRSHAHPKTWGHGFAANNIDMSVDTLTVLPSKEAELHNLEMVSDLSSSLNVYQALKDVYFEISGIPQVALGRLDNVGNLSGLALKVLYQALLEKNNTKQLFYGSMFGELNGRLLELRGLPAGIDVGTVWQNPLPTDKYDEIQQATALQEIGVSKKTLLTDLGFDPEEEAERRAEEANESTMGAAILDQFDKGSLPE